MLKLPHPEARNHPVARGRRARVPERDHEDDMKKRRVSILAGSAVVLSHGLGDDSSTWDGLVPSLAERHRVVSWDLRGHGASATDEWGARTMAVLEPPGSCA